MLSFHYLNRASSKSKFGFVDTSEVTGYLQSIGFNQDQSYRAIMFATMQKLIETEARKKPKSIKDVSKSIRITTLGAYHVKKLISRFVYMDAIIVDTPILDNALRKNLNNPDLITERLDRTKRFKEYLDNSWTQIDSEKCGFNWIKYSDALAENIESIRSRLNGEQKYNGKK